MENNRKHLDALRISLEEQAKNKPPKTFAMNPVMRLSRSGDPPFLIRHHFFAAEMMLICYVCIQSFV
jgi:hypothetical protein